MAKKVENLRAYFLNLLAKKDYSRRELIQKANLKQFETAEIAAELDWLKQKKFQSDQRLAENLVEFYQNKGQIWLKQKMQQRLLNTDIIEKTLTNLQPNYELLKQKTAQKYHVDNWKEIDAKTKRRILIFLQYQGFANSNAILKNWQQEKFDHNLAEFD